MFLRLFPEPPPPPSSDHSQNISDSCSSNTTSVNGTLTKKRISGRELIPRSLSSVSSNVAWNDGFPSRDSGPDLLSSFSNCRLGSFHSQISTSYFSNEGQNESQVLFYKYGSCFSQLARVKYHDYVSVTPTKLYRFSLSQLQTILSIAKKLSNRNVLTSLDDQVREFLMVSLKIVLFYLMKNCIPADNSLHKLPVQICERNFNVGYSRNFQRTAPRRVG